jgi:uncharacterized protein
MSYRRFRLIISLALAAFVLQSAFGQNPPGAAQGDSFNSNTNTGQCGQAYSQAMQKVSADNTRIQAQWRRDQASCNGNSSCLEQAQQRRIAGERDVYQETVDANAQKDLCELRSRGARLIPSSDPCEQAYRQAMEKVAERNIQIRAQWYRDQADCNSKTSCVEQAQQNRLAAERAVHEENVNAAAQKDRCHNQRGLNGQVSGSDPSGPAERKTSPRPPLLKGRISNADPSSGAANPTDGGRTRNTPPRSGASNGRGPAQTPPHSEAPVINPNQPIDYFRGFAVGMGDCFTGFVDLFAATGLMAKGDFVNAAKLLGVEPGKSLVLKSIWQELVATKLVGKDVSYYDQGRAAGRRICTYALVPGALKVRKALATAGETSFNPIRGPDLAQAMASTEKGLGAYSGKWIATGKGPVQLGKFVGKGSFSSVFEMAEDPNKVIKIGNNTAESSGSFARQIDGARRLKSAGVDTPDIHYVDPGTPSKPGTLITGNVFKRGPPGSVRSFSSAEQIKDTPISRALQDVYDRVAQKGFVWGDGHLGNIVFEFDGAGGWKGIVIDPDMVMSPAELADSLRSSTMPGNVVSGVLAENLQNLFRLFKGESVEAGVLSDDLFAARGFVRQRGLKP